LKDDKTIKQPTNEEWKNFYDSLIKSNIIEVDTLGNMNKTFFEELQQLAERIEQKTKELLQINFSNEEIEKMFNGTKLDYQFKIADYEKKKENIEIWEKTLKKVDNNFVADNFFLMFSSFIVDIQDLKKEESEANFDTLFWAESLMSEKDELIHDFDKLEEQIEENNRKIGELGREVIQNFTKRKEELEINGKMQEVEMIDLTDSRNNSLKILEHTSKAMIDEIELFKLNDKTRLQLKVFIDTIQEKENFFLKLSIKGEPNYFSKYYSIEEKKTESDKTKDFKDIKMKTQAISMYKPTQIIFLEGEEISKIYKEQAIVTIPFGLKIENENEVTYQITNLNYEQSDKDLRFFNACISAQWNLIKNKYPINTFIEESTLYQIYIGDTSFTYRPKKKELEKMHDSIMGMNSNQAKMQFESSYNHLTNEQKIKYIDEGTILPVRYKTIEIEKKNGQKYSKKGYVFESIIPLFSFMNELKLINTAPLQIESVLKSSQMNDEITRILKEEIAQLYYFKSRNKKNNTQNGFKRKVFVTEEGKELTPKEWNEKNIESKRENKKNFVKGYWKYIARRTIDSMIKDCKFTTTNGEILNAYNEKSIDRKTYSRFIDSVITFLRYSKDISYGQDKYIKDFILYDKKGNIVKDSDFRTENERLKIAEQIKNKILAKEKLSNEKEIPPEIKKKITKKIRQETGTNPSIDKIDIIIS
jgi:hypothetical protein